MSSGLRTFGGTARGLARNPLGIIALFIVLVYGLAALVLGLGGDTFEPAERVPLVWFLVIFPVIVLTVFGWLVSKHHTKLFAPQDFRDESNFIRAARREIEKFEFAAPSSPKDTEGPKGDSRGERSTASGEEYDLSTPDGRSRHRHGVTSESRGLFLAHILAPSRKSGQLFDISVYLVRHHSSDFSDVAKAEFFFGRYWGNRIFSGTRIGASIGVRTSAYGPFLCTCLVTFTDGKQVILSRYIDFEMGRIITEVEVDNST